MKGKHKSNNVPRPQKAGDSRRKIESNKSMSTIEIQSILAKNHEDSSLVSDNSISLNKIINLWARDTIPRSNSNLNVISVKRSPAGSLNRNTILQQQRIKSKRLNLTGGNSFLGLNDLAKFGDGKNDGDSSMVSGKSNLSDVVERVQNSLLIP